MELPEVFIENAAYVVRKKESKDGPTLQIHPKLLLESSDRSEFLVFHGISIFPVSAP